MQIASGFNLEPQLMPRLVNLLSLKRQPISTSIAGHDKHCSASNRSQTGAAARFADQNVRHFDVAPRGIGKNRHEIPRCTRTGKGTKGFFSN